MSYELQQPFPKGLLSLQKAMGYWARCQLFESSGLHPTPGFTGHLLHPSRWECSSVAQWVKNLLAMQETQETWVRSLGHEDPLDKESVTHSSILAWKISWWATVWRVAKSRKQLSGSAQVGMSSSAKWNWALDNLSVIWVHYTLSQFRFFKHPVASTWNAWRLRLSLQIVPISVWCQIF